MHIMLACIRLGGAEQLHTRNLDPILGGASSASGRTKTNEKAAVFPQPPEVRGCISFYSPLVMYSSAGDERDEKNKQCLYASQEKRLLGQNNRQERNVLDIVQHRTSKTFFFLTFVSAFYTGICIPREFQRESG